MNSSVCGCCLIVDGISSSDCNCHRDICGNWGKNERRKRAGKMKEQKNVMPLIFSDTQRARSVEDPSKNCLCVLPRPEYCHSSSLSMFFALEALIHLT